MEMHIHLGARFEHSRLIIGSPRAGTARPDICTITRITKSTIYYRNESGMSLKYPRAEIGAVVKRFIDKEAS